MNIPIIKLEVQGMKHTILAALTREAASLDANIQAAVESYCSEENIQQIVEEEARRQVKEALKQEVQNFFRFGATGRIAVREAVHEYLNQCYPTGD